MLTKEEIEVWRRFLKSGDAMMSGQIDALCDMALASITHSEIAPCVVCGQRRVACGENTACPGRMPR